MTDTTRQILLTLSDGDWHDLIGAMFTITPRGEAAIKGDV